LNDFSTTASCWFDFKVAVGYDDDDVANPTAPQIVGIENITTTKACGGFCKYTTLQASYNLLVVVIIINTNGDVQSIQIFWCGHLVTKVLSWVNLICPAV
jgi:hypothetical protein